MTNTGAAGRRCLFSYYHIDWAGVDDYRRIYREYTEALRTYAIFSFRIRMRFVVSMPFKKSRMLFDDAPVFSELMKACMVYILYRDEGTASHIFILSMLFTKRILWTISYQRQLFTTFLISLKAFSKASLASSVDSRLDIDIWRIPLT